jgi:hypothetical protein
MFDRNSDYDIQVVMTADTSLAAVYDSEQWARGLLMIFDKTGGESWTGSYGLANDRADREKWASRYRRLLSYNPQLPTVRSWLD